VFSAGWDSFRNARGIWRLRIVEETESTGGFCLSAAVRATGHRSKKKTERSNGMKGSRLATFAALATLGALTLAGAGPAGAQAPPAQERVAALKASLAQSQQLLRQYEWIETRVVNVKGEEKSRIQNRCYYGADGKLQKVPVTAPPPEQKQRGLRGAIAESKKEELTEYMKSAVALVKSYIPPDPASIEASKSAGKMSVTPAGPRVRLDFRDYQKPGDTLSVEVDLNNNTLLGLKVDTWLKDPKDKVTLVAGFGSLNDGATYPAESTLSAPSESLKVTVTNSGYRKQ
jgi:hypothetical protein